MDSIKIYCDKASTEAKKIFTQSDFAVAQAAVEADILWIRRNFQDFLPFVNTNQIINHLPSESQITTKGLLTKNLKNRDNFLKKNLSKNFYQESYLLSDQRDLTQFFINTENNNQQNWILKPTELSQGCGVKILTDLTDLKFTIVNQDKPEYRKKLKEYFYYDGREEEYIIQRHIDNPLLLNNKKSEIRVYWLVLSIEPLYVIFYHDAIVRICSEDYTPDDYSNPLKHITNVYQQTRNAKQPIEIDLKLTMTELKDAALAQGLTTNNNFIDEELMPKIKQALSYIILAAKQNIVNSRVYKKHSHLSWFNYFGLYGCDIMLDNNLTPWVLEVQKGPGLSFDSENKAAVLCPMIKEGMSILHDFKYKFVNKDANLLQQYSNKYSWLVFNDEQK